MKPDRVRAEALSATRWCAFGILPGAILAQTKQHFKGVQMAKSNSFSPQHLTGKAKVSGFLQCPKCGLVWFGMREATDTCPEGPHGRCLHVAVLCRDCDAIVSIEQIVSHLTSEAHIQSSKQCLGRAA